MMLLLAILIINAYRPGFEFMRLGQGGRPAALGEAYTALSDDVFGIYHNPSGLTGLAEPQLGASYCEWFEGLRFGSVAFGTPLSFGTIGVSVRGLFVSGIEQRSETDPLNWNQDYYGAQFVDAGVSYGKRLGRVSVGANLHGVYARIEEASVSRAGVDIGGKFDHEAFAFGTVIQNLGPEAVGPASSLPVLLRLGGAAYLMRKTLCVTADLVYPYEEEVSVRGGVEYRPIKLIALRAGYRTDFLSWSKYAGLSGGIGVKLGEMAVDYTFTPYDYLGNTHRIALAYSFVSKGQAVAEEIKKKETMMSDFYVKQGVAAYNQKKWNEAGDYFDVALIWNPANAAATSYLERMKQEGVQRTTDSLFALGNASLQRGVYPDAIYYSTRVLELVPGHPKAADLKTQAEQRQSAAAPSRKADVTAIFNAGLGFFTRGEYGRAIKEWEKAIAIEPGNQAIADQVSRARARMNEEISVRASRADAYFKQEKYRNGLNTVDDLYRKYPDDARVRQYRDGFLKAVAAIVERYNRDGAAAFTRGNRQQAEEAFDYVLSLDPRNNVARTYLAKIEATRPKKEKGDADRYYLLGIDAYTKNNYVLALEYWQKALVINPDYPNARINVERAKLKIEEMKNR